jgi:hypothetical protein
MSEAVRANDIRNNIRDALLELQILHEQGRIVMTQDRYNTDFPDSAVATKEALQGLELAMNATHWMETLPHPDGGYPRISE